MNSFIKKVTDFRNALDASRKFRTNKTLAGFTLVELIVVIAILAILATLGFLALSGYTSDARESRLKTNVRSVFTMISAESALSGNSPRYYVVHETWAALSWAFVFMDSIAKNLTGWYWNQSNTNYSAGNPDYVKLRMNPEKFKLASDARFSFERANAAYDQKYLTVGAFDWVWGVGANGKSRVGSYLQTTWIEPTSGMVAVASNFPQPSPIEAASWSALGLVRDPLLSDTWALVDGVVSWTSTTPYEAPPPTATVISSLLWVGYYHSCAVTAAHGVKCWWYNLNGRLGDSTTTDRTNSVDVTGLSSGVAAVSGWRDHTCVLTTSGGVKCWGDNSYGQLGDGTTVGKTSPVDVTGLASGVVSLSSWYYHTCVLTTSGGVKCWGRNDLNQLWDGTAVQRTLPTDVFGLTSGVSSVSAGFLNSCVLTTSGGVKCWGYNDYGQVGDGTIIARSVPTDVTGLSSWMTSVTAWGLHHACALTTSGGVKCWGRNGMGEVGDATTTQRKTPVDVSWLTSWVATVVAWNSQTCAILSTGAAKCWWGNNSGQIGDNTWTNRSSPTNVTWLSSGVTAISVGSFHVCAKLSVGNIKCWGANNYGQVGDGGTTERRTPSTDVAWF